MKKFLITFAVAFALNSCGSDDSSSSPAKPSSVSVGGDVATFAYDNKNRIQSVTENGDTFTITYNTKGKTDRISVGVNYYQFSYNGNNISAITGDDGSEFPIVNIGNNSYTIDGAVLQLTSIQDVSVFGNLQFEYGSAKGAFANVKSFDPIALFLIDTDCLLYASKKRITSVTSNNTVFNYVYAEGENGLPAGATVDNSPIVYTYTE